MSLVEDIIESEILFPRRFADVEERDYGILYHTSEIPDSHDGNHAHILRPQDCAAAGSDVEEFYRSRGLSPRVYHHSRAGEGRQLRAALQAAGFRFYDQENQYYVHTQPSRIVPCAELAIK